MHNPGELHPKTVQAIVDSVSHVMDGEWGEREWDPDRGELRIPDPYAG